MSKSNMEDGAADAFAAVVLISVVIVSLAFWLGGMPS